jgi:hypothetical protein
MSFFFFTKSENRRVEEVLPGEWEGLVSVGGKRWLGKSVGGQIWCRYYIYM